MDKTVIVPLGWTNPELVLKEAFNGRVCRVNFNGSAMLYAACIPCKNHTVTDVVGAIEMNKDRDSFIFKFSTPRAVDYKLMWVQVMNAINAVVFHDESTNLVSVLHETIEHLRQSN